VVVFVAVAEEGRGVVDMVAGGVAVGREWLPWRIDVDVGQLGTIDSIVEPHGP